MKTDIIYEGTGIYAKPVEEFKTEGNITHIQGDYYVQMHALTRYYVEI